MAISIDEALAEITRRNPILGAFLNDETTLLEHSKRLFEHTFHPLHLERQRVYKKILKDHVDTVFLGETDKPRLNLSNESGLIISTADHHGIHNYPPCVGGAAVVLLSSIFERETKGDHIFLNAAKVPLNEIGHRRGIDLREKHINLFPKQDKHKLVYSYPKTEIKIVERMREAKIMGGFSPEELQFLQTIDAKIGSINYAHCETLAEQIEKINYHLWPLQFDPALRDSIRRPITIAHDTIITEYLVRFFLRSETVENNFVHRALFDPKFRAKALVRFQDIYGCWDSTHHIGTHFFWYILDGEQYSMWLKDGGTNLVGYDENGIELVHIPFTPEALAEALAARQIVASIFLKFSLIGCWMGVKMMGGPNQIQFSTEIKKGWLDLLNEKEAEPLTTLNTTSLSFTDAIVERRLDKTLRKANFLDTCYSSTLTQDYLEQLMQVTVQEAQLPTVDINYMHSVPPEERRDFGFSEADLFKGFSWVK